MNLETYSSAYLAEHPETHTAIRSDSGHDYVFPFLREDVAWLGSYLGAEINAQMLTEVGMDVPETFAEWESTMYAFKELDDCDSPFCPYDATHLRYLFGNAFGFNGVDRYYVDQDGKVASWMNSENYYDFLVAMNRWYNDGILDPDFATMDMTGFVTKVVAEHIGASFWGTGTPARFIDQLAERDGEFPYVGCHYPVANAGDPVLFSQGETLWLGHGAVITTACENVELAMRFLDYGYTEEGIITWNYGKEGISFTYDENGIPHTNPEILNAAEGATQALSRYTSMTSNGISIMSVEWNKQKALDLAIQLTDDWTYNTEFAALYRWPAVCATIDEKSELSNIETTVKTYADEMYLNFIIGNEPLNEDTFAAYINTINEMGMTRVLEIKADQVERYNNR